MKLISTRDPQKATSTYSESILQGLAPDGGLFVPLQYPQLDTAVLRYLAPKPYVELFAAIKQLFVDDISPHNLITLAEQAYTAEKFPHAAAGNLVPVTEITAGLYLQNLSLGPTAAFKDMALQPLAQDINYVLGQRKETLRLLGATSGDTGSAAEGAIKGLDRLRLFMLSPEQGMSPFQRAQMRALSGGNVFNVAIRGRFDDCQDLVKDVKQDPEFADVGAVNSINWGRIASQVPYYVSGYLQTVGNNIGLPVDFVIPTGNFGNIFSGYVARIIGVPIRRLIVATNENDVMHQLIQTGIYTIKPAKITSSPSMDISKASNFERLLYEILERSPERVRTYMEHLSATGNISFADAGLPADILKQQHIDSGSATHADRVENIRWTYKTSGQIIDPHTATAIHVARKKQEPGVPMVCLATALPVKFEQTIQEALGFTPEREPRFSNLEQKTGGFVSLENDLEALKTFIRNHSAAR